MENDSDLEKKGNGKTAIMIRLCCVQDGKLTA